MRKGFCFIWLFPISSSDFFLKLSQDKPMIATQKDMTAESEYIEEISSKLAVRTPPPSPFPRASALSPSGSSRTALRPTPTSRSSSTSFTLSVWISWTTSPRRPYVSLRGGRGLCSHRRWRWLPKRTSFSRMWNTSFTPLSITSRPSPPWRATSRSSSSGRSSSGTTTAIWRWLFLRNLRTPEPCTRMLSMYARLVALPMGLDLHLQAYPQPLHQPHSRLLLPFGREL